jgi:hypothetical protein
VPESGFFAVALENLQTNVNKWERLNPSDRPLHLLYGATSLTMRIGQLLCAFILSIVPITAPGQQTDAPRPQRGSIRASVTDVDDDQCEPVRLEPKSKAAIVGVL